MERIYSLCVMTALISFLGFIVENIWIGLRKGYMDNRNMVFPFLFGYGIAVVGIYLVFNTPRHLSLLDNNIPLSDERVSILLYFAIVMLCISLGEIILGKTVERFCHIKWWDYSTLPLHITQYSSFFTSFGFTLMIVFFMDKIFVPLYDWFLSWDSTVLAITSTVLIVIMTVDFVYSGYLMYTKRATTQRWMLDLSDSRLYKKMCNWRECHKM
ncbi:MAG: putative ABC transporter permease [Bacteroides sp.]|nr:putative ABC transporter permease [Eubacterium sp.]MCM1417429.1 putative ABC transporter permease [Roseburia sp.]MCM1461609.1 putative ABC transporter permease [Bacteroides sp.]